MTRKLVLGAALIGAGFLLTPAERVAAYDYGTTVREQRAPVVRERRTAAPKPKPEDRKEYPSSY